MGFSFAQEDNNLPPPDGKIPVEIMQQIDDLFQAYNFPKEVFESQNKRGPAPPLYYLQVMAARSSDGGTEGFDDNQFLSEEDHGGAQFHVLTIEYGYGFTGIAKINNVQLPLWKTHHLANNGIVYGFVKIWDATGFDGGLFSYPNTSVNVPHNTMSDWIRIR